MVARAVRSGVAAGRPGGARRPAAAATPSRPGHVRRRLSRFRHAMPGRCCSAASVPATLFVATAFSATIRRCAFWWDRLWAAVADDDAGRRSRRRSARFRSGADAATSTVGRAPGVAEGPRPRRRDVRGRPRIVDALGDRGAAPRPSRRSSTGTTSVGWRAEGVTLAPAHAPPSTARPRRHRAGGRRDRRLFQADLERETGAIAAPVPRSWPTRVAPTGSPPSRPHVGPAWTWR